MWKALSLLYSFGCIVTVSILPLIGSVIIDQCPFMENYEGEFRFIVLMAIAFCISTGITAPIVAFTRKDRR